mmetsp:Transcript_20383/g.38175  ORF Transcript_20383/g.38175 Transcript_20383/m.38175 type:complete len:277 (-) Transcript_20383:945-1775(-)
MDSLTRYDDVSSERRRTAFIKADIALSLAEQEISFWREQNHRSIDELSRSQVIDLKAEQTFSFTGTLNKTEIDKDIRIANLEQELEDMKRRLEAAKISEAVSRSQLEKVLKEKQAGEETYMEQLSMLEAQMQELELKCTGSYLLKPRDLNSTGRVRPSSQRTLNTSAGTRLELEDKSLTEYDQIKSLKRRREKLENEISVLEAKRRVMHSKNWEDMREFYEDRISILQGSVREWKQKCFALSKQMKPLLGNLQGALSTLQSDTKLKLKEMRTNLPS